MELHLHPTGPTQYVGRKAIHQAASSTHLVDMDGLLSPNEIQRLLGKKLAIGFSSLTIQVDELDVKVVMEKV
ncbi:bacteriocin [Vibrio vulnificus]|uniref:bacteriocin n=1 Tax=Vibrio vulnificus TaxID=672 RepID=UPI001CDC7275|nr:bacteriocin [Vibrio vulnificus]MCA3902319.1 bacteriocin [Vibrio vulnificus]